ncbi:MAG: TIGR03086 family metal-binding protein [Microthrixaceae bacterium]
MTRLNLETPCSDWNVGQPIDHLIGAQYWARRGPWAGDDRDRGGSSSGDYVAAFDQIASESLAAFSEDGALERVVNPGFGDMPAAALMGMASTDTFTHSWDLARATGQDTDLAPELASALLEQSRRSIQDAFRSEDGRMFGLEQPAPEDATPAVNWRRSWAAGSEAHTVAEIDYLGLPAADIAATKAFYTSVFGWSWVDYGPAYSASTSGPVEVALNGERSRFRSTPKVPRAPTGHWCCSGPTTWSVGASGVQPEA